MIWIDFAIIGLISIYSLSGLLRGFSLVVFSVINWVLAAAVALVFCLDFSVFLAAKIIDPTARIAVSFAILFLLTLIVGILIRFLLGELVNKNQLNFIDRFGGMLFGVAHGMIAVTLIIMLAGLSVLPDSPWWGESKMIPPFQATAIWMNNHIPSELAKLIHYH
ncbi:MAG: CvpA family protein [Methylovulum sp.]